MKNGSILKTGTYLLIMVLLTMSILVACAEPAPAPTTPAPTPAPTTPAPAPTPAPPTKMIIGVPSEPGTLDPSCARAASELPIFAIIYDPLVGYTNLGKAKSGIGIASWEISEDGKVIEFTLRQGVKFHSGDPMTTKDIVFTHNRYLEKNPGYPVDSRNLDRLEVIDDYKIRFIFKVPDVRFLLDTATHFDILSQSYYDKVGEEKFMSNPVGTGAYKFVEWKLGQYIDFAANENYWGGDLRVKQARLVFAKEETTRVAMLQAGEVDVIYNTPWQSVGALEKAGFKTVKIACAPDIAVQFHTLNPNVPWYDKRVRQAFAYAIDRESIVKNVFYSIPEIYAWLAPGEIGYEPEIKPYPYDPAKAKQLLAEAGYPDGFEMQLYYWFGAVAGTKEVTEAVVLYLDAIGIKCKVTGLEGPQVMDMLRKWHTDTTAEVVLIATPTVPNNPDPICSLTRAVWSKNPLATYANPEIDALLEEAMTTFDDTKRGELIKKAIRLINDDLPTVQILSSVSVYAMKPNVDLTPVRSSMAMISIKDMGFTD